MRCRRVVLSCTDSTRYIYCLFRGMCVHTHIQYYTHTHTHTHTLYSLPPTVQSIYCLVHAHSTRMRAPSLSQEDRKGMEGRGGGGGGKERERERESGSKVVTHQCKGQGFAV